MEKLLDLICDEFAIDKDDINEDTLLEEIVSDEFELQQLIESINEHFEIELDAVPDGEWSIADLAKAISNAE